MSVNSNTNANMGCNVSKCEQQGGRFLCCDPYKCRHKSPKSRGVKCTKEKDGECFCVAAISKIVGKTGMAECYLWVKQA